MALNPLDADQIIRSVAQDDGSGNLSLGVSPTSGQLVTSKFNEIDLTYVVAGNGVGEIATAIYKQNGSVVATLTLSYDSSNRLSSVIRS